MKDAFSLTFTRTSKIEYTVLQAQNPRTSGTGRAAKTASFSFTVFATHPRRKGILQAAPGGAVITPQHRYKEIKIGKTLYRVTSVFTGEKDLGETLEQLAVRRAMAELTPCHATT